MSQKVTAESYLLIRSRRRTLSVEVRHNSEVVVRAPLRMPQYEIDVFLRSRAEWIAERVAHTQLTQQALPVLSTPDAFYHRGGVRIWQGTDAARNRWERAEAYRVLSEHVSGLLPRLGLGGLRFKALRLRRMRGRWGSCSHSGTILLNTHLIRVPDHCAMGVVAHELAHLIHMNHGMAFKQLLAEIYPAYRLASKELDLWTSILTSASSTGGSAIQNPLRERGELRLLS